MSHEAERKRQKAALLRWADCFQGEQGLAVVVQDRTEQLRGFARLFVRLEILFDVERRAQVPAPVSQSLKTFQGLTQFEGLVVHQRRARLPDHSGVNLSLGSGLPAVFCFDIRDVVALVSDLHCAVLWTVGIVVEKIDHFADHCLAWSSGPHSVQHVPDLLFVVGSVLFPEVVNDNGLVRWVDVKHVGRV